MSKLTLSINEASIKKSKEYAKSNGKSLSGIVEAYLNSLTQSEKSEKNKRSHQNVSILRGSVKMSEDFISYK